MEWADQINLQELRVAVAPLGGLVAVVRDDRRSTPVQTSGKPTIFIFSPSGQLRSSIKVRVLVIAFQVPSYEYHQIICLDLF